MDILNPPFDDGMKTEIETIRQSVHRLSVDAQELDLPGPMALVSQADSVLQRMARWMLDEEQMQVMEDHPWQVFFCMPPSFCATSG